MENHGKQTQSHVAEEWRVTEVWHLQGLHENSRQTTCAFYVTVKPQLENRASEGHVHIISPCIVVCSHILQLWPRIFIHSAYEL
jgi:hypothetical protein